MLIILMTDGAKCIIIWLKERKYMTLQILSDKFSVSKLSRMPDLSTIDGIYFTACTDREISLVCGESSVPLDIALCVDSGWRAMRIKGELDFSLVGILSAISDALASCKISVFALSTYDTDYVLVKDIASARACLESAGYEIEEPSCR